MKQLVAEGSPQCCEGTGAGSPSGMIVLFSTSSHLPPPLAREHNPRQILLLRINMHNCNYLFNDYPWKWIPHPFSVKWLQISCNWASSQHAALMHSAFSHHDRLVLLTFTLIACPLMPQPDTDLTDGLWEDKAFCGFEMRTEKYEMTALFKKKKKTPYGHFFVTLSDWSFLLNLCEAL